MPTPEEFRSATSSLQELARRYHNFKEDPESFLQYLKNQKERSKLREYLGHVKEIQVKVLENVQQIRPVVFLRRIIVERILNEERITAGDIQELQERIDDRDTEYFSDYPDLNDEIANQKERANSAFNSWDLFKILFGIDYYHRSDQAKEQLRTVAEFLQEELGLSDCDYHRAAFDFNNNFGTDTCWIALYPEEAEGHQSAYQIFFGIQGDQYKHGIIAGGRLDTEFREVQHYPADEEIDPEAFVDSFEERLPQFKRLNRDLSESQLEEGRQGLIDHPLNKILYGPPGTGKTYSMQKRALRILEGTVQNLSDTEISERFRSYLEKGRIAFTTFHPSYSYEEFVEGLRYDPETEIPQVQDGILKDIVRQASSAPKRVSSDGGVWKISLGRKHNTEIFNRCIENSEIAIGFHGDTDLSGKSKADVERLFKESGQPDKVHNVNSVDYFINEVEEGDYVLVYNDAKSIRAIGIVTGAYEWRKEEYDGYPHVRSVEWLDQEIRDVYELNGENELTRPTLYPLDRISAEDVQAFLSENSASKDSDSENPYVLIIDEINRGNLSRIFGELVTLLESDKRRGAPNEMSVTLPYSQDRFSLPSNLYVLGTMNTADRSIALVDVALRRRFDFEEMMPDASVIRNRLTALLDEESEEIDLTSDQIDLIVEVFQVLNRRVSYLLDRDHQIGHSYFLEVESMKDLHEVWYSRVLPLLQEYFYNDRRRLVNVLGEHDPDEPMGFVEAGERVDLLGDGSTSGQAGSWEFYEYQVGKLEAALRNTFSG